LLASSLAGEWGDPGKGIELLEIRRDEPIDHLPRPQSLAADNSAFAITIVGDSMWPRFRPGRRVAVSPRSPVAIGDDVLVRLRSGDTGGDRVLLKELVKRTADELELRQFKPEGIFSVAAADVEAIDKVLGELI
jgi:phage repressor protein C with HTH and peptisase S24 domain